MTDADRPLSAQQSPAARALGPAVRLGHVAVAGRGRAQGVRAAAGHRGRRTPGEPHRGRAAVLLRARQRTSSTFPDWETLPYDLFSPHPDIVSQRLRMLSALPRLAKGIVIVDLETLLQRLPPQTYIDAHAFDLQRRRSARRRGVPRAAERRRLRRELAGDGARRVRSARLASSTCIPMGSDAPYRIDLFDDEVETIRVFDPETQRSGERAQALRLLPAREFPLTAEGIQAFQAPLPQSLPRRSHAHGRLPRHRRRRAAAGHRVLPAAVLRRDRDAVRLPAGEHDRRRRSGRCESCAAQAFGEIARPVRAARPRRRAADPRRPPKCSCRPTSSCSASAQLRRIELSRVELDPLTQTLPYPELRHAPAAAACASIRAARSRRASCARFLDEFQGRVLIAAESAGRREMLLDILQRRQRAAAAGRRAGPRSSTATRRSPSPSRRSPPAWCSSEPPLALIAEEQLFGERARQERRRRRAERDPEKIIRDLTDLHPGSPVVHEDYGVGRYRRPGDARRRRTARANSCCSNTPTATSCTCRCRRSICVSRYTGAPAETAPLHKLGGEPGKRRSSKAAQRIRDIAAELLDLYSRRAARQGEQLAANEAELRAFEAAFPFEETPDQAQAIEQVIADLASGQPMDRVVCGDVGFGKTEVALRAAFVAVQAGKQVAVLVPTTLLAQQHYQTFARPLRRLAGAVESLSRFRSAREVDAGARRASRTARSTSWSARIGCCRAACSSNDLGLLIIDEEHRFGVKDKETLKQLRAEVRRADADRHADPAHAQHGDGRPARAVADHDAAGRAPVDQDLRRRNGTRRTIREACLREIRRGGQIYFVHNSVDTIEQHRAGARRAGARSAHRASATARCASASSSRSCSTSTTSAATCWSARRSSKAASTCRPRTRSSSIAPTSSASRSCISCAAASAVRTTRRTPTC